MTNAKNTKRALLSSVLALFLCFVMLLGTTFAWFTDSVSSVNNIIQSGNLDIELEYYDGDSWEKVTETTNVFKKDARWEPGHTEVVYLKVSNLGSLALKYNLGINIVNEVESVNVEGKALRLSNYIMFGAINDVETPYADRAAARAAVTEAKVLSTGYTKTGSIEAGGAAQYVALVVYMPENVGNEANHREGAAAPKITLGINLMATQYTSEEDGFGKDYDEGAKFDGVPTATTTVLAEMPTVTTIGGNTVTLDTGYVFETTATYDEAQMNAYRYWHADFVAYFDQDVDDAAIGLAGQYDAYSPDWLAFELDGFGDIAANTPVRMLEFAGIAINYEELCDFVKKFSCGAFAVDPEAMAGKTMTVELRLYETTKDPNATSGTANEETGEYITIGTYSYTFDAVEVADQSSLNAALAGGTGAIELAAGEYKMPSSFASTVITITGTEDTVLDVTKGAYMDSANVTIKGVTIKTSTGYVMDENGNKGSDYAALYSPNVTYIDCTFEGPMRVGRDGAKFINCTFNNLGNDYVWTYGNDVTFEGCTFNTDGKAILIYSDGGNEISQVVVKNCVFNSTTGAKAGAIANQNCAAIEIHNYGNGVNLVTEGNTYDSNFSGEWRIKTYENGKPGITVNGVEYTTIAINGNTMTIDANKNVTVQ